MSSNLPPLHYARLDQRGVHSLPRWRIRWFQLFLGITFLVTGIASIIYTVVHIDLTCSADFRGPPTARVAPPRSHTPDYFDYLNVACFASMPLIIIGLSLIPTSFLSPEMPAAWSQLPADRMLPRMALWRHQITVDKKRLVPSNAKPLKVLRVFFDDWCIGEVVATTRTADKFFGYLVPNAEFQRCRSVFEEAWLWSRRFEEAFSDESIDDTAWEYYSQAIQRITDRIKLPDFPFSIDKFAIDHYLAIEVRIAISSPDA